jgi:hypothetical protein
MRGKLYKLQIETLPDRSVQRGIHEYMGNIADPWGQVSMSPDERTTAHKLSLVRHAVEVKHYRSKGEDHYIAMDHEVFSLIDFVFDEERYRLQDEIGYVRSELRALQLAHAQKVKAWRDRPWYSRIWSAMVNDFR